MGIARGALNIFAEPSNQRVRRLLKEHLKKTDTRLDVFCTKYWLDYYYMEKFMSGHMDFSEGKIKRIMELMQ